MIRKADVLAAGTGEGPAVMLKEPLSFWGGIEPTTGSIIDRSHPDLGRCVSGAVLVLPGVRGSSSSSSILAEALRLGTAPAAIVLASADPILTVGALVAEALYGRTCPIVVCGIDGIVSGDALRVEASPGSGGTVHVRS